MRRFIRLSLVLCLAAVLCSTSAHAQRVGIGARVGTLGPGLEVTANLVPSLNLRVGANYFTYSRTDRLEDLEVAVEYDADLTLNSVRALLDWHPFGNQFRLTAGGFYNRNRISAVARPVESYTIKQKTFEPEKIGSLTTDVKLGSAIAPYAGLGVGNAVSKRIGFAFDLGVLYTNSPAVSMQGEGLISPTARQASDLEEGFSEFSIYPLLSLGLSIRI